MSDPWLNFQYTIEFSDKSSNGLCSVLSINSNAIKHGSNSYIVNPEKGNPIRKYIYGGSYTEPVNVSILLGEGARPWLKWFSQIQSGNKVETRNITISLFAYGQTPGESGKGQLWLRWDLLNCFPVSWQIGAMAVDDSPSPMKVDMTLQFESMVILDGDNILHEAMG